MRFELIATYAAAEELHTQWEELLDQIPQASPFMSWAWQSLWWRYYGAGRELRLVAVWEQADSGPIRGEKLVALWPLYIRRDRTLRGLLPVRVLQPLGVGGDTSPEYLDPLVLPHRAAELAPQLARFVVEHISGWDELRLPDLRASQPFADALQVACRKRDWPTQQLSATHLCYLGLPESWDAYLASLSRDRRQKLRWMRKKYMEQPGTRFYALSERVRLDEVIDRLIELHHLRWQGRGSHAFSSDAYRNFHRAVMHAFWDAGRLRLYCLEFQDSIVMIFYCYVLDGVVYHMQTGFDPSVSKWSPGHVMIGFLVEHAIGEGAIGFDMLAGQNAFKLNYARETRTTQTVVAARTLLARVAFGVRTVYAYLRPRSPSPASRPADPSAS